MSRWGTDGLPLEVRFWMKAEPDPSGCLWWNGHRMASGYGQFNIGGNKKKLAHRLAYELVHGPIPAGHQAHHTCGNVWCVNPNHVEVLSPKAHRDRHAAVITHCPRGHAYDSTNTYRWRDSRYCRACNNDATRRRRPPRG